MKYIFALFFLLICDVSNAFVYEIDEKNLVNPSQFQVYQFKNHFSKLGYNSVGGLNSLTRAHFYFDQAFVSFNWKEAILLKAGLKAPRNMNGVVIEDSGSGLMAFHFKLNEKYFLLLGIGVSRNDFEKAVQPWTKTKVSWIKSVFLSTAQADGCNCEFPKNKMQLSAASLEKDSTLQTIGRCATDAWGGFESSVNGTLEFFKKLATDPKTLWLEMKQSFLELK